MCLKNNITCLSATLGNKCNDEHINRRVSACRKAFYSLQGAGLCSKGLDIQTLIYVWNATCKSLFLYSCESLYINSKNLHALNKLQSKLIKCIVGIGARYHTSPLLQALGVENISNVIEFIESELKCYRTYLFLSFIMVYIYVTQLRIMRFNTK